MSEKFSLSQQVEEIMRELALREKVYPGQVRTKKMRQSTADYHMARMRAVLWTLTTIEREIERARNYDRMNVSVYLNLCEEIVRNIDRALQGELK